MIQSIKINVIKRFIDKVVLKMAKVGYARVSKQDQSLDLQIDALEKAGCEKVFSEKASGAKTDRPELQDCLDYLRKDDVLVVYKLDRLGRTTKQLINLIEELQGKGIHFQAITNGIDTSTPQGKFFFTIMAGFAEMERELIRERTNAGLEAARARGRKGGRPKTDQKVLDKAIRLYETKEYTVKEITEMTGVSKPKLYQELNKRKEVQS
jgi:DNA invertase Pin-like site-specific DNA recombinase